MTAFPRRLTSKQRAALAVWLVVLTAAAAVRFPLKTFAQLRESPGREPISSGMARFAALRPFLQPSDSVGYLRSGSDGAAGTVPDDGRCAFAQNVLLPVIVRRSADTALVIFDADDQQAIPLPARTNEWSQVVDLQNGVRLYRTRGGG